MFVGSTLQTRVAWLLVVGFGIGAASCAESTQDQFESERDSEPEPYVTVNGKGDLPNDSIYHREHDRSGYAAIADDFQEQGFDLAPNPEAFDPIWPMRESATALLNRFGTPILLGSRGYMHTALDIYRKDVSSSDEVLAPISGTLRVYNWSGDFGYHDRPYATVVAIWDPQSHYVVQMMHVEPTDELKEAEQKEVEAGEVIGRLAKDLTWIDDEQTRERLRHTHVDVIDGANERALDPAPLFPYEDERPPEVEQLYVLDEEAKKHTTLQTGQLDVVLEVFDRDATDHHNYEAGSIAYTITDGQGNVLAESEKCNFDHFVDRLDFENLETTQDPSPKYLDFGNAQDQMGGGWPNSDLDNHNRTFRYALTQFAVDENGRCQFRDDSEGFIEVADAVETIEVRAEIWDQTGNSTTVEKSLERGEQTDAAGPDLVVNEILASVPDGYDANGDGVRDAFDDEFVELVSAADEPISLEGYKIRDEVGVRHVFSERRLEPGHPIVVFGGGDPAPIDGAQVVAADRLGLNDSGDTIELVDPNGAVVDTVSYGYEGAEGVSLTRATDGDPDAEFVQHDGDEPATPGRKRDGSTF